MALQIIPRSLTDDASIVVVPDAEIGLGPDNLQLSDRGLILRVLSAVATITATMPQLRRIGGVVLWRHALSVSATVRVRAFDNVLGSGVLLVDTGTVPAVPSKTLGDLDWGVDLLGAALSAVDFTSLVFSPVIARSLVIDISDPGGAQIDVGRLFVGLPITLTYLFDWGSAVKWDSASKRTRTASGGLRVDSEGVYRVIKLSLGWVLPSERPKISDLLRDTGDRSELWLSARAGDGGQVEAEHALVGYLSSNPFLTRMPGIRYTTDLTIEES